VIGVNRIRCRGLAADAPRFRGACDEHTEPDRYFSADPLNRQAVRRAVRYGWV